MYLKLAACLESIGFSQKIEGFGPYFWFAGDMWCAHIIPGIGHNFFTLYHPMNRLLLSFEFTDAGIIESVPPPSVECVEGLLFLKLFMLEIPELQTEWMRNFIAQQSMIVR